MIKKNFTKKDLANRLHKKLGFSKKEFDGYMEYPYVSHFAFPSYAKIAQRLIHIHKKRQKN